MRRRLPLILVLAVALAGGATVVALLAWREAAARIEAAALAWIDARRAEGFEIAHGAIAVDGFPFSIRLGIDAPVIARASAPPNFRWEAERLELSAPAWAPRDIDFVIGGANVVDIETGSDPAVLRGTAHDAHGTVREDPDSGRRAVTWSLERLFVGPPETPAVALTSERVEGVALLPEGDGRLRATVDAREIVLPRDVPLGRKVERVTLDGEIDLPLPDDRDPATLAAWRDRSGRLDVHRVGLHWGPMSLEGAGALTLDHLLRPAGRLDARASGYDATLDALAARGAIERDSVPTLKLVLGLLATGDPGGGPRRVEVAVTLADGWAHVGPVKVAPLASLATP